MADHSLSITSDTAEQLRRLRAESKFIDLPGVNTGAERARLESSLKELVDRLLAGISANPRKAWILAQFKRTLEQATNEDTEARERFGVYLERIMDIFGIQSSDGLLSTYP
ncbi:MAG TPA: DUF4844 domain-containing protein [Burkholderiales bacterium]|nr:DUF4844 domain-containing protein [Burkholderiales bacterium]